VDGLPALTPWDIDGPHGPTVGRIRRVERPSTRPETGPAITRSITRCGARRQLALTAPPPRSTAPSNAQRAGVAVDFGVADATRLDEFADRFDPVVDSAFYHVFVDDREIQGQYMRALHRATKSGARLFMFEFGRHHVNGIHFEGLAANNFEQVLPSSGWGALITLEPRRTKPLSHDTIANMSRVRGRRDVADRMKPLQDQLRVIAPLLENHRVHMPFWTVAATRLG